MTQRSKKHHYLPRFILSGFAQDGQVRTVDLASGRSFLQSVFDAAAENDYNTLDLDDGTKSDVAEKAIAEHVETPAAMVLQRITAGGWLDSPDERLVLAKFLALQFLRVPRSREAIDRLADETLKLDIVVGGPQKMREVLRGMFGREPSDAEVREYWDAVRDFDDYEVTLPTSGHVLQLIEDVDHFAPSLAQEFRWHPIRWESEHLLTSDQPVVLIPAPDWPSWRGAGLLNAGAIFCPISRRCGLFLRHTAIGRDGTPAPARNSQPFNQAIARSAGQRLYHHPADSIEALVGGDFALPRRRPVTLMMNTPERCATRWLG